MKNSKRFIDGIEILDELVLEQHGCHVRVRRWLRGIHPDLGVLRMGWTGLETITEEDIFKPTFVYPVLEAVLAVVVSPAQPL